MAAAQVGSHGNDSHQSVVLKSDAASPSGLSIIRISAVCRFGQESCHSTRRDMYVNTHNGNDRHSRDNAGWFCFACSILMQSCMHDRLLGCSPLKAHVKVCRNCSLCRTVHSGVIRCIAIAAQLSYTLLPN